MAGQKKYARAAPKPGDAIVAIGKFDGAHGPDMSTPRKYRAKALTIGDDPDVLEAQVDYPGGGGAKVAGLRRVPNPATAMMGWCWPGDEARTSDDGEE